jgi:hypothetical protein
VAQRSGHQDATGALFNQRTVRKVIANDAFIGRNGYPRIVSDELAARARAQIVRLDPAEIQRRKGGRRPKEPYALRGITFCAGCGAALYRSYAYLGGNRAYACRNRLEATGTCRQPPIPADVLESHVLNHLGTFVGSVEKWIAGVLCERNAEALTLRGALDAEKARLSDMEQQRAKLMTAYERLVSEGDPLSRYALEPVAKLDADTEAQEHRIAEAEARLSEWSAPPDVDEALDFYSGLVDVIQGRISKAPGIEELNEALASILAGLWCELDQDETLRVRFALRAVNDDKLELPPAYVGYLPVEPLGWAEAKTPECEPLDLSKLPRAERCYLAETLPKTTVNRHEISSHPGSLLSRPDRPDNPTASRRATRGRTH